MSKDQHEVEILPAKLNHLAPGFKAMTFHNDKFSEVKLGKLRGKFVVLFFYPADFTFVCPTELEDMAEQYSRLQELDTEVLGISTDTHFVHKAWYDASERIRKIRFPMVNDANHDISLAYGVLRDGEGVADQDYAARKQLAESPVEPEAVGQRMAPRLSPQRAALPA
ncbi:MAG: redoxin domain-containing protein, partial [Candidatus Poseidoniia archaeon]|nr:redoxin domain-containing protein [Candidatus Poseidoniia archaeon]